MWKPSRTFLLTISSAVVFSALGVRAGMAELVDTERGLSSSISQTVTEQVPTSGRNFLDLALLVPGVVAQNDRQEFGCAGTVTAGGAPVKGFVTKVTVVGVQATGEVTDLNSFKLRSSKAGILYTPSLTDVTGANFPAYGALVITSGPRKADTLSFRCTYRDYDPCPADTCFGPIVKRNRFVFSRIPTGWIKNYPNEIENGVNERWQVKVFDRCRRSGGFEFKTTQTVGTNGSLQDAVLLDTQTGLEFPGPSRRGSTLDQYADIGFKVESWCGLP